MYYYMIRISILKTILMHFLEDKIGLKTSFILNISDYFDKFISAFIFIFL